MLVLLAAVTVGATPAPPANDAPVKPRTPLGVRPKPSSPDDPAARVPLPPRPDSDEAGDDSGWARDDAPPRPARKRLTPDEVWDGKPAATEPRETVAPSESLPVQRAKRFIGALLGGAVGLGVPLALLPLADQPCARPFPAGFSFCPTAAHVLIGTGALVTAITGAALGVALAGGEVSGAALVTGTFLGLFLALTMSAITVAISPVRLGDGLGVALLGAGAGFVVAGQALATLLRDDALETRPWLASSAGRIAATSFAFVGTLGAGLLSAGLIASAFSVVGAVLSVGLAVLAPLLAPLAAWAAHRAMDGQGGVGVSYLATLGVAAIGFLGAALFAVVSNAFTPGDDIGRVRGGATTAMIFGGLLVGALGVPLALEVSHASALIDERTAKVQVSLGGAPVPGGGVGVVTARF